MLWTVTLDLFKHCYVLIFINNFMAKWVGSSSFVIQRGPAAASDGPTSQFQQSGPNQNNIQEAEFNVEETMENGTPSPLSLSTLLHKTTVHVRIPAWTDGPDFWVLTRFSFGFGRLNIAVELLDVNELDGTCHFPWQWLVRKSLNYS